MVLYKYNTTAYSVCSDQMFVMKGCLRIYLKGIKILAGWILGHWFNVYIIQYCSICLLDRLL